MALLSYVSSQAKYYFGYNHSLMGYLKFCRGKSTRLGITMSERYMLYKTQLDLERPYRHVDLLALMKNVCLAFPSLILLCG